MKKSNALQKTLAVALTVLILLSVAPLSAMGDIFPKLNLGLSLNVSAVCENVVSSGSCGKQGDNVTWTMYENKTLVLTGRGETADFDNYYEGTGRWNSPKRVVIGEGITKLGNYIFNWTQTLNTVYLPASLVNLGYYAFGSCSCITDVYYASSSEKWAGVNKGTNNGFITAANIHYNTQAPFPFGHDWSTWTDNGDDNHIRTCSRCAIEETAAHVWNDGVVTKEATCKEQGAKLFTCTVCDTTKTELIPIDPENHSDYGTHLENEAPANYPEYGYTGDAICNGCGAVLTTGESIFPVLGPSESVCCVGDRIQFGSYPQTEVEETEALSSAANAATWKSFIVASTTVRFADFSCDGEEYRAVESVKNKNGYSIGNVYYFRYEPLIWRVLDPDLGFVVCENIIDSRPFQSKVSGDYNGSYSGQKYANDYSVSQIRSWLNSTFYNTAFTDEEKEYIKTTTLDNKAFSDDYNYTKFNADSTNDKVFLLSWFDALNPDYGFENQNTDAKRVASGTDYAKCQGLDVGNNGCSYWWLRTAGQNAGAVCNVNYNGALDQSINYRNVSKESMGVRPACRLQTLEMEHNWDAGFVTKEATCKEEGETLFTCTVCGATKTEPIVVDPANHADYGTHLENASAATCLEAGYTGDTVCNGCGATLAVGETIDPLGPNVKMLNVQKISDWQTVFSEDPQLLTFTYKENKDDEFVWIAQVTPTPGLTQYRVTDTLPEGVELVDVKVMPGPTITAWNYGKTDYPGTLLTIDANGALSGEIGNLWMSRTVASGQLSTGADGRQVVDITLTANSANADLFSNTFFVVYYCKLSEDAWPANGTVHLTLNNTVHVESNGDDYGEADNTIIIDASNTQDIVDKSGDWDKNTHMITYTVDINPGAENLLTSNGGTVDPNWLTFTDKLTYQAKQGTGTGEAILSLNSVRLEEEEADVWTQLQDIHWTAHTETDSTDSNAKHAYIEMRVPDEKHLRLTYSYHINSSMADGITLSNSATVEGHEDESGDDNTHISGEDFQTSGESTFEEFCLIKIDQENGTPLSGAVFTVYTWDAVNEEWSALTKTYTTDQFGRIIIKVIDEYENGTKVYQKDTAYCIMETTAPPGYILPMNPQPFYFWFSEEKDAPPNAPADFMLTAADISTSSRRIEAENMCEYVNTCDSGHDWGDWTDNGDGNHSRICKRDSSHVETAVHVWNDGVVTIQPKAETPGETTYTCTVCGAVKIEPIPAIGWTVTFMDDNGDALGTQTGATLEEAKGKQSDPTKDADAQYTYAFDHWDQVSANETTGEAEFVAVYTETLNSYEVKFVDENGDVLKTQTVAYSSSATAPADPAKGDDENKHYEFAGWDQDFSNITGNLTVTATYTGEAHVSKEVVTVPATCEGEGTKQIVCEVCNRPLDTQTIDPLGHDWGAWSASGENHTRSCMRDGCNATQTEAHAWTKIGETNADCTNAGSITWRCDVCSAQKTETVDPNGHQLVKTEAVTATCLEDGNSVYYTCSVCGKFFSDEAGQNEIAENSWVIGALGHDWGDWTKLNDNEHQRVCKRDASHKETANHVWNDGVVTKEPTCKEQGSKQFTCTVCNATKTETIAIDPANHADYGTHFENAADATCLEKGYTGDTVCNGCGKTLTAGEDISPLDHDWGDWKTTTEPTVYSGGEETRICKRDPSHKETRETDPLPSFEVTFVVGEETVQTVRVAKGAKFVEEPDLTAYQQDNKTVVWEEYTLNDEDITIHAIITEIDPNEVADGIDTEKTVDQFENGKATITLSASSPSRLVKFESTSTKPVDVIMVLDLSGSMDEEMGNQETKMQALKDCTNTFLNALNKNAAATGADHRVALVGFASGEKVSGYSMTAYQNTGLIVTQDGGFVSYNDRSISNSYAKAWMPTGDALGVDARLAAAVNGLTAGGSTNTQLGLKMAQNILSTSSGDGREKIVLLITDGVPTVAGIKADEIRRVAPLAVTYANEIKNLGVKLYTVGVDADADENAAFTAAADGVSVKNGTTTFDFNRFLNIVSSNYPGAKAMNDYGTKQNSGYYMSVNHTDKLNEIFEKVLYSSVYKKLNFQRCTLVDTLSKDFVLTMEQEQALKDNLAQQYNLSEANVMVRCNADGTTTLRIVGVPAVKCTENGKIVYRASVSFEAALAKYQAGEYATNTEDAYVEVEGERVAAFEVPENVTLNADRNIVVFTLNGTVYRIEEGNLGDVITAPVSGLAKWNIPEGTEIANSYTVFEADEISTDTYTVTWSINGTQTTDSYHFGDAIQAPEVADLDDLAFAGFMPWVPATMPARNMTFTATYAPKHTHAFAQTVVGNCKTDLRIVKTCACGETVVEAQPAREHQFSAVVDDLEGNTLTDMLICSVCGASEQHTLTFQTVKSTWGGTTVLDLSLEKAGTVIQPAAGSTIKIMVPWTNQGYTNTNVRVIRVNEQGVQKTYTATIENGYLVFYADHFSIYLVEELDSQGQETEPVSYKAAVCTLNGTHVYTDTITPPTCKEKGYTTHTCASCGDTYTDNETAVDSANHAAYGSRVVNGKAATCKADGYTGDTVCNGCGATLQKGTLISKATAQHSLTHINAKAATTEAEGNVEYYHCSVCGMNFSDASGTKELTKVSTDKLQKPTEPEKPDNKPKGDCKYCGETHTGPFGWLIKIIHSILALFGLRK